VDGARGKVFAGTDFAADKGGAKVRGDALDLGAKLADRGAFSQQDRGNFPVRNGRAR
jgi:hypothetical protein